VTEKLSTNHKLRAVRRAKGVTQRDLADAVGTKSQFISKIEKGRVRLSVQMLHACAEFLEVRPMDLLEDAFGPDHADEGEALHLFAQLDEQGRQAAVTMLKALTKTAATEP